MFLNPDQISSVELVLVDECVSFSSFQIDGVYYFFYNVSVVVF